VFREEVISTSALLPIGNPDSRHTFHQFQKQGYEAKPVDLQVSFGKGDKVSRSLHRSGNELTSSVLDESVPYPARRAASEGH
jgi:hypothetical protein